MKKSNHPCVGKFFKDLNEDFYLVTSCSNCGGTDVLDFTKIELYDNVVKIYKKFRLPANYFNKLNKEVNKKELEKLKSQLKPLFDNLFKNEINNPDKGNIIEGKSNITTRVPILQGKKISLEIPKKVK